MEGLINGTYHLQLSKKEMEAVSEAIRHTLFCIDYHKQDHTLTNYAVNLIDTLENVVPKFTP